MCREFGSEYYSEECQKHTEALGCRTGGAVCTHTKMWNTCVHCYCELHLVKLTGTASLADSHSIKSDKTELK